MAWQGKTLSKPSSNTEETLSMKGEDTKTWSSIITMEKGRHSAWVISDNVQQAYFQIDIKTYEIV